jgi:hypothetical protein
LPCRFPQAAVVVLWLCIVFLPGAALADEISFRNDVMAVLSKAGCNAGACHGNASGKAGFKLSLRGQDPELDFYALTRDQFGRRVDPVDPENSLILLKPTTQIVHEGGKRFSKDSPEYETLRRWLAAALPNDVLTAPKLKKIEVTPAEQMLIDPASTVQLRVRAEFSDGSQRDVTPMAVYDPANGLAKVAPDGLVRREGFR